MSELIRNLSEFLWGYPFIILLVITSVYLSIKFKFPQLKIIFALKDLFKRDKNNNKNKITSFRSLMTILAGTLGTGNITGVATSIVIGGVGSLFWLFVSGIFAMTISYAENLIVLTYRKKSNNGFYGGTMYVLDEVLNKKSLAIFFSIVLVITSVTTGTMTQSNSLSTLINTSIGVDKRIIGIILLMITLYIIFGGKRRLAKASSIVIPICSLVYITLCISIIYINSQNLTSQLKIIVLNAFGIRQFVGGVVGLSIAKAIGRGFSIGMFSNEAGMGSAPIFTATVEEQDTKLQAKIAANSVVIDTLILCTLTGITIACTGLYNITDVGLLLNEVFKTVPFGNTILNICMVFFVISTIPCWEYYGEVAIKYLFNSKLYMYIFRIMYAIGIYVGCIVDLNFVWDLSGILNAIMTLPNIYMIYKCVSVYFNDIM